MTTIRSMFGMELDIDDDYSDNEWVNFRCEAKGRNETKGCQGGRLFKRADLLDALGAVPTADMAREIGEEVARRKAAEAERDEYRMAAEAEAEGLNEWKARAEAATEALAASQERCSEHMQLATERADVARTKAVALAAERDHWQDRAERAEATVERVRAILPSVYPNGKPLIYGLIEDALDPKPAFTLPTEVPARIEARDENGPHHLVLWTDGEELLWHSSVDGDDYSPGEVIERFTDHRLIGADE